MTSPPRRGRHQVAWAAWPVTGGRWRRASGAAGPGEQTLDRWPPPTERRGPVPAARDVHTVVLGPGVLASNVYLVGSRESWVLIDAGWAGDAEAIRRAAETLFGSGARPAAVVLTHIHPDHSGAAGDLAHVWQVPVYVSPTELPMAAGRFLPEFDMPLDHWVITPIMRLLPARTRSRIEAAGDITDVSRPLDPDGVVPGLLDWEWIATPGHTPGSVAFLRRADGVLVSGDALVTVDLNSVSGALSGRQRLAGPPLYTTWERQAARRSIAALAELQPRVLLPGHGYPLTAGTAEALHGFARGEQDALPAHQPDRIDAGLAVYRIGTGPPVLLMPAPHRFERVGLPDFDALVDGLVGLGRQVITYDPPGSGWSAGPAQVTLDEALECTDRALDACGISGSVDAVGHSMAGLTLLAYALERPGRIGRLVLVGTGSGGPACLNAPGALWNRTHPAFPGAAALGLLFYAWPRRAPETLLSNFITRRSFVERRFITTSPVRWSDWLRAKAGHPEWHRVARTLDYRPRLGEIAVPTLVLCGRADVQFPLSCSEELAAGIPNARLVTFATSNHFPHLEEPEAFWAAVRGFLARDDERPGSEGAPVGGAGLGQEG